jgi:7-carboxy-7-deazaguanine synthase
MRLSETFYSVQGEGSLLGVPSFFIRTSGCNLRCTWCDTPYASWKPEGGEHSIESIMDELRRHPACRHVVVTGGEPMIMRDIGDLLQRLHDGGWHTTVETAATVPSSHTALPPRRPPGPGRRGMSTHASSPTSLRLGVAMLMIGS